MRRALLHEFVTKLVRNTWGDENSELAEAVLNDDLFGMLCRNLDKVGDKTAMRERWETVVDDLDFHTLDWLVDEATSPACFLANRVAA